MPTLSAAVLARPIAASTPDAQTLVVLSRYLEDAQTLQMGVLPGVMAVVLECDRPLLEQVTELLQRHQRIQRLVIVAHGEPGVVHWGDTPLTTTTLVEGGDWRAWRLEEIVLCSCRVGADREFVEQLAAVTGSRVIASAEILGAGHWLPEMAAVFNDEVLQHYSGTFAPKVSGVYNGFGAPTSLPTGSRPYSTSVGDFNGDGVVDLVAANRS
ncbi:MAG: DUF4347 domain-containing protein [Oculatellaceae cyanobacterium Prado106]|nr:DUF4347 domain-containing protein [Oculatellaceae cyanobacterium Prado106]